MKFVDHLDKRTIKAFNRLKHELKEQQVIEERPSLVVFDEIQEYPNRPVKENLSRREWEELMGTRRDTYERRRGAVRRKLVS